MINEAQGAETRKDFIHKMKIASKEAEETEYWLNLCNHAANYPKDQGLHSQIKVLNKLLTKIIATAKKNCIINH